ncbi:MAG: filamentous hemagglutinin N-terminal domain-containing protein, partial [Limnobacter sp.]|nr:filamentous hemagglutinin N-terminal domain-containing protein [Limnobacter sp.]
MTHNTKQHFQKTLLAAGIGLVLSGNSWANPSGLAVVAGQASAKAIGNLLEVTNSPGAVLNWQQFNIGQQETTRFIQENAASHVVNRVTGGDISQILGSLQSNGQVFLINPAGIVFGQGAQVNTAGLLATTLTISNDQINQGALQFSAGDQAGAIKNHGNLTTHSGGSVILLAPQIENSGLIHADGEVLLAAGHEVTIVDLKHPTLGLQVKVKEGEQAVNLNHIVGQNVSVFSSLLENTGVVEATGATVGQGGVIQFRGEQSVQLTDTSVLTVSSGQAGRVEVSAPSGHVMVGGQVRADSAESVGGEVVLTGQKVAVIDGARVSADGQAGGGSVSVGGGWQGANPAIQNAKVTVVQKQAKVSANALGHGDGGEVVAWADQLTSVSSTIEAKGGAAGGNGGRVETSAKGRLLDVTPADTSAPKGKAGEWLLDPANIVVLSQDRLDALGLS